jgi:branched-chain amino acid transport system substrate-binding protein
LIRLRYTSQCVLAVGFWIAATLLGACAQATASPVATTLPSQTAVAQTIEVEVTRVVYRETLVTPTPAPLAPCSPERLADTGEVVIGALLPLSTPGVWMRSANMQAGLNLALERLNMSGVAGVPARLVLYDTGDDPARSAQMAEQLITRDCAVGLIVGLGDAASKAVIDVAERFRKPTLIIDASDPALTANRPEATFRLAPTLPMIASMPAQWLAEVGDYNGDGVLQAVVIAENSPAGDMFVEQAHEWFPRSGINVEIRRVDLPMTDFSPEIARLLSLPTIPDAVFIAIGADNALDLQEQLFDAGIRPDKGTLIVNHNRRVLDPSVYYQRRSPDIGVITARRGPWPSAATEMGRAIFDRYRQSAMQWPEFSTFLAYDAVWLLADAMQRAPSLSGADLLKALAESDVELAAGRYTFPYGASNPPEGETPAYAWHQWMTPPLLYLLHTEKLQDPTTLTVIWPEAYRTTPGPLPAWK